MRPRRKLLRWSMVVAILALGGGIAWWWLATTPKQLSKQHFVAVTMELFGPTIEHGSIRAEIHDPAAIYRLARLLDSASPTREHTCSGIGSLRFKRRNGSEVFLGILPGHDAHFYEYMREGYFRVDRKAFFDAMSPFGIPSAQLEHPPARQHFAAPTTEPVQLGNP